MLLHADVAFVQKICILETKSIQTHSNVFFNSLGVPQFEPCIDQFFHLFIRANVADQTATQQDCER